MADGRIPDDGATDDDLRRALRRASEEARPRAEFRERLREGFVEGHLVPAPAPAPEVAPAEIAPLPAPSPAPRRFAVPRWAAYPAAAAVLLVGLAFAASMRDEEPDSSTITPTGSGESLVGLADPAPTPDEVAMTAAERRIASDPVLGGRTWQRRLVHGRPWLFPAEAVAADAAEIEVISKAMAEAESALDRAIVRPLGNGTKALPVVAVVAPSRDAFEALAMPLIDPLPLDEYTIAFGLRAQGVLLISPETLAPGGPPCEAMDVVHEAAHAWLHARQQGTAALPLWVDEGLAEAVSMRKMRGREACRSVLGQLREVGLDPYAAEQVLGAEDLSAVAEIAKEAAPCDERPYSLVPAFYMHSQSLVAFLLEEEPAGRREAFLKWLDRAMAGERTDPDATARALGFESAAALFAARDAWLGL